MAIELAAEIQKRYGFVRRARGCYLYTEKGVRLTDCYLDGGRALLGWDGGKARTVFKDTLERGANGSYCGGYESHLATAVRHLLPSEYTEIRWYYDSGVRATGSVGDLALGATGSVGGKTCAVSGSSADGTACVRDAVLWRPWLDICAESTPKPTRYPDIKIVHPITDRPAVIKLVPPYPWATSLCIYASCAEIPPSDVVPAPLLAAYARAFYDLKTALGTFGENDFKQFSKQLSPLFDRRACWLFPKIPRDSYDDFAKRCLDAGIVVSPHYDVPSIIPWRANKGDIKRIADCI